MIHSYIIHSNKNQEIYTYRTGTQKPKNRIGLAKDNTKPCQEQEQEQEIK